MPQQLNLQDILKLNPQIDANLLHNIQRLRKDFQRFGGRRAGYNLAMPFERRHVIAGRKDDASDRAVRLRASQR